MSSPPSNFEESIPRTCPETGKRRRFRFKESHDIAMLQAVVKAGAHIAPHGLAHRRFDEATQEMFQTGVFTDVVDRPFPSPKTIWDRFRHLVSVQRRGVLKCGGDREVLLNTVITAMEANKQGVERCIVGVKRPRKPRVERVIRPKVAHSSQMEASSLPAAVDESEPAALPFLSEPKRLAEMEGNTDDSCDERWKRRIDALKLDLEKKIFEAEEQERKRRYEIDARQAKIEENRAAMEMRRLQMEDEDRKCARQERQALTTLLTALAQTLMKK